MIHYHNYVDENGELYTEINPYCFPTLNADSDFNQEAYLPSIEECLDFDEDLVPEEYEYPNVESGTAYTMDCY